jgi:hypothetical protein
MLGFVSFALEVEVVFKGVIAAFVDCREHNRHIEFSPALLLDLERRLLEY